MASMAELARQLLVMNGNSVGGVSPDRYMEIMDRSPYGTGVPLEIGYGEQDQMSPLDAAAIVTGGVPVVGDLTGLAADVDMYMRDPESRNIPNYLLTAAGALPFLPAASQVRQGIKAYHGSPHSFDRFSTEQIGTGEGAQAYGRGLYFAGEEGVAKGYRDSLSRGYDKITIDGETLDRGPKDLRIMFPELKDAPPATASIVTTVLKNTGGNVDSAIAEIRRRDAIPLFNRAIEVLEKLKTRNVGIEKGAGSMYEVNIDVEPDELIDWDQLIDEQPSKVLDKLKKSDWWEYAEEGIYDRAGARGDNPTGADLIRWLEEDGGEYAAEALKDLGVKGIRYADAFTRHKTPDKRSMNYVIFDDRLIYNCQEVRHSYTSSGCLSC
jgi:hypothetical protein